MHCTVRMHIAITLCTAQCKCTSYAHPMYTRCTVQFTPMHTRSILYIAHARPHRHKVNFLRWNWCRAKRNTKQQKHDKGHFTLSQGQGMFFQQLY